MSDIRMGERVAYIPYHERGDVNAAQDIFAALDFRPGDAGRLRKLERYIDKHVVGLQYTDEDNEEWLQISYMIDRLQEVARMMEQEEKR